MSRRDEILLFWFGGLTPDQPIPPDRSQLWFGGSAEIDQTIRDLFSKDVELACAGKYDSWSESPRGALTLVLLLDQFTRNIYRNTPDAFASDGKALSIVLNGVEAGLDRELELFERPFFYLPLEHSENLEIQQRSVAAFQGLVDAAPPAQRKSFESYHDYAVRHLVIIERFGRFPHRNSILGRESTAEEVEFLKQPGSSF